MSALQWSSCRLQSRRPRANPRGWKAWRPVLSSCWCIPIYGEQKSWGCRWWTKWIQNIEKAVREGVELEVYFFKEMCGKGKVEHFLTVGKEYLRRKAIFAKRNDFMKSEEFLALKGGLDELGKACRADSSSPYSRELHRLFLASLSEEERSLLEAAEGLGDSQKAEVAWLERKGYAYTAVDVSTWLGQSCFAAISQKDQVVEVPTAGSKHVQCGHFEYMLGNCQDMKDPSFATPLFFGTRLSCHQQDSSHITWFSSN